MDLSDCDAASGTIYTMTLTPDMINQNILHRLMRDDPELSRLELAKSSIRGYDGSDNAYYPSSADELHWLGYFVGRSSHLTSISIIDGLGDLNFSREQMSSFTRGFNQNKSIREIDLVGCDLAHRDLFQMLGPFFHKNESLEVLRIVECTFGRDSVHQLSSLLETVKFSCLYLVDCALGDEDLVRMFDAVKMQTRMEDLNLAGTMMGRIAQTQLATIVRDHLPELENLTLVDTEIDDESIEGLARVLTERSPLKVIDFSQNHTLTDRGYQAITTMLESPNCGLECLVLAHSNVDDDRVTSFANAMANNESLGQLLLCGNPDISARGWEKMARVLCDTSGTSKTFLSNHTLWDLGMECSDIPAELASLLEANKSKDKATVRVNKILAHHGDFGTYDFFKFGLKMLPPAIGWLERAADRPRDFEANIPTRKLSAVYQSLRTSPCSVDQRCLEYIGAASSGIGGDDRLP